MEERDVGVYSRWLCSLSLDDRERLGEIVVLDRPTSVDSCSHASVLSSARPAAQSAQVRSTTGDGVAAFVGARPRMLGAAFRTLRNAAEAEDIVQDVWLRWQGVDHELVRNAPAFLTTVTTRLALNRATGARARREMPLDHQLVEPADLHGDHDTAERVQELESALLRLLTMLSPAERAAYLLREAFNYSYRQIARVVGVTEANSRQLVTRARKHLAGERRAQVRTHDVRRLVAAFHDATQSGNLASLEALLAADISGAAAPRPRSGERSAHAAVTAS